jgi:histidine triad (HIT) family protein
MAEADCLFCKISSNEIPAKKVYEDELVVAFNDIAPKAPVHILVVPHAHYRNVAQLSENPQLLAHLVEVSSKIAVEKTGGDYTLVFNTGQAAGQTIFHVHGHIIGGANYDNPFT